MVPFVGEIRMVAFGFAPKYWAACDGQPLPIAQHPRLFELIARTYGGDGTTFKVPDLRGVAAVHGPGNQVGPVLAERGGAPTHTLTFAETAQGAHSHQPQASKDAASSVLPAGNVLAKGNPNKLYAARDTGKQVTLPAAVVAPSGGAQPHENMAPYLAIGFCISLDGTYPIPGGEA